MGKAWKYTGPAFKTTHLWWSTYAGGWSVEDDDCLINGFVYRPANSTDRSPPDEIIEVDNETEMRRILAGNPEVDLSEELLIECSVGPKDDAIAVGSNESWLCIKMDRTNYPSLEDTKRLRDYLSAYIEMKESE